MQTVFCFFLSAGYVLIGGGPPFIVEGHGVKKLKLAITPSKLRELLKVDLKMKYVAVKN